MTQVQDVPFRAPLDTCLGLITGCLFFSKRSAASESKCNDGFAKRRRDKMPSEIPKEMVIPQKAREKHSGKHRAISRHLARQIQGAYKDNDETYRQ